MKNIKDIVKHRQTKVAFIVGVLFLYTVYFIILTWLSGDWRHAFNQFGRFWYWLIPLGLGFGVQSALFWYVRYGMHLNRAKSRMAQGTSLGTSTLSMAACCAHHVVDIVPFLGITALATIMSKYQEWFFFLGVLSNLIGIYFMYSIIQKNKFNLLENNYES